MMNRGLGKVAKWLTVNRLSSNVGKTERTIVTNKFLSVIVDNKLSWR